MARVVEDSDLGPRTSDLGPRTSVSVQRIAVTVPQPIWYVTSSPAFGIWSGRRSTCQTLGLSGDHSWS
ncbi:MAG: hypothetical protein KC481_21635, partial [Acidimicrobiaceae bacterium]|nr:hypothetical protein [Acidimicrobiaceae bacterium]